MARFGGAGGRPLPHGPVAPLDGDDPRLVDDFVAPRPAIDVAEPHEYSDKDFTERARRLLDRDREILDRLAN